jgi:hypothetical protein
MGEEKPPPIKVVTKERFPVFIFGFHLLLVVLVWFSPILFGWTIILLGIGLFYLQDRLLGECLLTRWQFKTKHSGVSFYQHMLTTFGFKSNQQVVNFVTFRVLPWTLLFIALTVQKLLNIPPLIT